jgi:hypothetical protein
VTVDYKYLLNKFLSPLNASSEILIAISLVNYAPVGHSLCNSYLHNGFFSFCPFLKTLITNLHFPYFNRLNFWSILISLVTKIISLVFFISLVINLFHRNYVAKSFISLATSFATSSYFVWQRQRRKKQQHNFGICCLPANNNASWHLQNGKIRRRRR